MAAQAETNAVWFADWYLENLNALYSAPLDYRLWQMLDRKSPIASRLYEFLLFNFHTGTPLVRINYPNLAQLLPIRPEHYLSDAKRQMESAFNLLSSAGIIASAEWLDSKSGSPQLVFHRGYKLALPLPQCQPPPAHPMDESQSVVTVTEMRNPQTPEQGIVREFYKLWSGDTFTKPSSKELTVARDLLERYGASACIHCFLSPSSA